MKLRINVTQRDIDLGLPRNSKYCPLARAIGRNRQINTAEVGISSCTVTYSDRPFKYHHLSLPQSARDFRDGVDWAYVGGVKPFSFTLDTEAVY